MVFSLAKIALNFHRLHIKLVFHYQKMRVDKKTTYYLEYFLMIGQKKNCQDNDIIKFAQTTKDYFLNNDNQLLKNIEKYLDNIDQNKTKLLDDLVTNYNK